MRSKYVIIPGLIVFGGISLILAVLAFNLPATAQWFIESRYQALLDAHSVQFTVSHVGKNRTLVSDLGWGKDISADLVSVSYAFDGWGQKMTTSL